VLVRGLLLSVTGIALIAYLLISSLGTQIASTQLMPEQGLEASAQTLAETTPPDSSESMLFRQADVTNPLNVVDDMRDSYCLWPDDTLGGIAAAAGITVDQIMAANPDYTGFAGSTIFLPEGSIPPHEWTTPRPSVPTIDQLPFGVSGYYLSYDNRTKRVALSFDIGYTPENHEFMRWLKEQGIRATFLVMGYPLSRYPEVIGHILDNGHELGNHSYTHENMQGHRPEDIRSELNLTEKLVREARPNATTKPLFRAPFGAITPMMTQIAQEEGYRVVGWTIDSRDWNEGITAEKIYAQVTQNVCPGAIIALHDINAESKIALPQIIDYLRRKGYTFATVSELIYPPQTGG